VTRDALAAFGGLCALIGLAAILAAAAYGTVHLLRGDGCPTTAAEQPWKGDRKPLKPTPTPQPKEPRQ